MSVCTEINFLRGIWNTEGAKTLPFLLDYLTGSKVLWMYYVFASRT